MPVLLKLQWRVKELEQDNQGLRRQLDRREDAQINKAKVPEARRPPRRSQKTFITHV